MKTVISILLGVCLAVPAHRAWAEEPDAAVIQRITGLQPEVKDGVIKVSVPRGDLGVTIDGLAVVPFQGLTSWAAFQRGGTETLVMGDLTLREDEVNPVMSAALGNGLEVTALHNHFFFARPSVFFMHIGGAGTTEQLATAVRRTLDAVKSARRADGFGGPPIAGPSALDAKPLEAILGAPGQTKDGMVKFVFGRTTSMHGVRVGAAMGVATWAVFAGRAEAAVVDGDFAVREEELQPVLKSLRAAGIDIVSIHNHMTHEEPRIMFLHYWGRGAAADLARGLKAAIEVAKDA